MKREVRDDIIKLETFVDAEFKYRKYIDIIANCGGYCLVGQFKKHFKKDGGYYLMKKMEKAGLISTELFSNSYKYIKLTTSALKYFHYRDHEKDYSDIPKNKIPVPKNISKPPSEKVIYTSIIYFELYNLGKGAIYLKDRHVKGLEKILKKNYFIKKIEKLEKEIENYKSEIKIYKEIKDKYSVKEIERDIKEKDNSIDNAKKAIASLEKEIEYADELIDKIMTLRDISKLIMFFKDETLHVFSQYIVYPKTSYIQLIEDFSKIIKEHNEKSKYKIKIDSIEFHMKSIFDSKIMIERLEDKVDKYVKHHRDQVFMHKMGFDNIKFHYNELPKLREYSYNPILHEKKYIKEKDKKSIEKIISDLEKKEP